MAALWQNMFFVALSYSILASLVSSSQVPSCTPPPYDDLCIFPSNYCIRYYSNINVSSTTHIVSTAKKAIIVIHGQIRDADSYYCSIQVAAQLEGYNVFNEDIIIIAPRFLAASDSPKSNELYWPSASVDWELGWPSAANSSVPTNNENQVSSFGAIDSIVTLLTSDRANLFPNLLNITITGHSSGGQFVSRYVATSPITKQVNLDKYNLKFVAAQPSTYLMLDSRRWFNDEEFRELTTSEKAACPGYNSWIYGWEGAKPSYITNQGLTLELVKQRYVASNLTYLHGTNDVCNHRLNASCADGGLDTNCSALLQGTYRLERGFNFIRSLQVIFGKPVHRIDLVPFVGHDHVEMYEKPNGRRAIF